MVWTVGGMWPVVTIGAFVVDEHERQLRLQQSEGMTPMADLGAIVIGVLVAP